jgi:hypothetical protein
MIRQLRSDARGARVIEFAFLAPVFFLFLIGMMGGACMLWCSRRSRKQRSARRAAWGSASTPAARLR